ncbi:MAG TPA: alpha/beta fold hydrolase [Candidatus Dormibacteraeota bacterium]|jgi:pimeloyl-ACP methyl ester carboxylesterase|nr:alpha/beta fold hydrolase [Candidatus Dormibacteraeota bacterium]
MAIAPILPGSDCRYVRAAGTEVNVLTAGRGRRTAVLLHGFGDTHATWRHVLPALAQRQRVISLDLPGFGASPALPGPLLDGQVAAVEGVLDALGVDGPVAVIGNSMGGAAALRFALAHPDRTDRVVAIAPAGLGVGVPIWWRMLSGQLLSLRFMLMALEVVPPPFVESVARQIFLRLVVHDTGRIDPATLRELGRRYRTRRDIEDLYQLGHLLVAELASGALLGRVEEIDVPLLVLWGRNDRMVPVEHGRALAETVPGARLEVIDPCGHCPQIERPDLLLPLLESFLRPLEIARPD